MSVLAALPASEPDGVARDGLIGLLTGSQLAALPAVVQAVHAGGGDTACAGTLHVRSATSALGRVAARLMGMPQCGGATRVTLVIERPAAGHERWRRSFADELVVSDQTTDGARLLERIGRLQLAFELRVIHERLVFDHVETWAFFGARRLRIPRLLAPRVEASVGARPSRDLLDVSVRIVVPVLGVLLSYAGALEPRVAS